MEFDKDAHRLDFEHAVDDFFEDQAIYLVCNEATSTRTPMNVAKVDYQSVNVSRDTWVLDELTDHYFNEVFLTPYFSDSHSFLCKYCCFYLVDSILLNRDFKSSIWVCCSLIDSINSGTNRSYLTFLIV